MRIFEELNEHMRATEQKHLQVSVGYLGAMALALSFLAPSASDNTSQALFHTWSNVVAYYVMVMAGCATLLAQHSFRGWKKHYLVACKRLVARWPLETMEGLSWLRLDVGPYSHSGPYQRPLRGGPFKVSGDNGLYYFTIVITTSLVVILLIALVKLLDGPVGIAAAAISGLCYFIFLFRMNIAGIVRKRIVEQEWSDFRLSVLAERDGSARDGATPRRLSPVTVGPGNLGAGEPDAGIDRVDLRNRTHYSPGSSIHAENYVRAHRDGAFDVLGITDLNTIRGALELREFADFPVVIGEEVDTVDGRLVGLFLNDPLTRGRTALDTAKEIHSQGGLVYLQYPYSLRRRLNRAARDELLLSGEVDVMELFRGGPSTRHSNSPATASHVMSAASNACHPPDVGRCYVEAPGIDTHEKTTLLPAELLHALKLGSLVFNRRSLIPRMASRSGFVLFSALDRVAGVRAQNGDGDY